MHFVRMADLYVSRIVLIWRIKHLPDVVCAQDLLVSPTRMGWGIDLIGPNKIAIEGFPSAAG